MCDIGFFRFFSLLPVIVSRSSAQFVSPLRDVWEHLRIIITKWCSNEGSDRLCLRAGPVYCGAPPASFCFPVWQHLTFYRCCPNLTHAIIIGWAQEMQIAEDLLKYTLKGEKCLFVSQITISPLFESFFFFLSTSLKLPALLEKRSDVALHLWRRIFVSRGKLQGI